jgi:oligoribonuclease
VFTRHFQLNALCSMDEWCIKQHGQVVFYLSLLCKCSSNDILIKSGLTEMCLNSPHTTESVSQAVLEYMKKWVPKRRVGMLAGSSVHFDRSFVSFFPSCVGLRSLIAVLINLVVARDARYY